MIDHFVYSAGATRDDRYAMCLSALSNDPTESEFASDFVVRDDRMLQYVAAGLFAWHTSANRGSDHFVRRLDALHPSRGGEALWRDESEMAHVAGEFSIDAAQSIVDMPHAFGWDDFALTPAQRESMCRGMSLVSRSPLIIDSSSRRERSAVPHPLNWGRIIRAVIRCLDAADMRVDPQCKPWLEAWADQQPAEAVVAELRHLHYESSKHRTGLPIDGWTFRVALPEVIVVRGDSSPPSELHDTLNQALRAVCWLGLGQKTRLGFGQVILSREP
ncbi:MAG TPA: hypothetical protein PLF40_32260 [Kofleriaceae bacterium]|nr:hypothetical protein [Kofleriaceae bacterium]